MRTTKQTYEFQTLTQDFEHPLLLRTMPRGTKVKVVTTKIEYVPPVPDQPGPRREIEVPEAFAKQVEPEPKPAKGASVVDKPVMIDVTDRVL
ncbi:hypothetical protein [Roseiterribacter gracilis]|uniref:Uncharacterized protein n=1 Tax=Roseiterribacter gracilis TaxID=2812848 RepID=A0A8S8XG57_9PROT|nr:hypothetical protein TMPK1_31880 [Rhodospirillales bacterium TMPK1]